MVMPFFIARNVVGDLWEKWARDRRRPCLSVLSYWAFLRKKQEGKRKGGAEQGKEGDVMHFYCKGCCGGNLLEKVECARGRGRACLLVSRYMTFLRKEDKRDREGRE